MYKLNIFLLVLFTLASCKKVNKDYTNITNSPTIYHSSVKSLTDVIVHDIFSPPVASRIYGYASIAGYETARWMDTSYVSFDSKINHLSGLPEPEVGKEYCFSFSSNIAFLTVGKALIFSEDSIQSKIDQVKEFYEATGMPDDVFERSLDFGLQVAQHILDWSGKDNYKESRSFPKYSVQDNPASWKPTPPGYMDGIEPSWNKIRPMMMDSASQFKPDPPTNYNMKDKKSKYFMEAYEVYLVVKNASDEEKEIANFWDCNPFKLNVTGHVMHATKKISPGGHWINITTLACKKSNADYVKTSFAYATVSIGLFEAFISCWDEKYRSNAVRPETDINDYIDGEWLPLLQTPPFPEYTSGHSVASGASSVILTSIFGDQFAFDDDTEVEFGLPVRSFTSFIAAAEEAAISRFYGGIHFMPAITNGLTQGKLVGKMVTDKLAVN